LLGNSWIAARPRGVEYRLLFSSTSVDLYPRTGKPHIVMQSSMFNLRVPLQERNEVFLMNTITDAQLLVSADVAALLDGPIQDELEEEACEAVTLLQENGFLVQSREHDRRALDTYLTRVKSDTSELNVTVLTTLQCNFACDYCFQGDHGDYNKFAEKMTLETARRVATWIEREMDRVRPEKFVMTFFGGEPLLNLPVMYELAERLARASDARGIRQVISIITNGLLLTEEVVDRLVPYGLTGVKITLDGDRDTHNRMRPLRGGQGTFDRIIDNIRRVSGRVGVAIGGNFDESSVDSYPGLLEYLKKQEFADQLVKVNFKPIVRNGDPGSPVAAQAGSPRKSILPLTPVGADGVPVKPLNGTCMTSAGAGTAGASCTSCHSLDDKMAFLRDETRRQGFPTPDGVHNGPCHVHMAHAHTIGPDGSLYACPGFTGEKALSTGHIDDRIESWRESARERFLRLSPWKECGDCAYIPVCAGGCVVNSHTTFGDMDTPTCHKRAFDTALISLAHQVASAA
jgi:uncharacterized protein